MRQRLYYFDMMKGVAIFLVVMGHVITMCVREVDRTPLFKFIEQIHMPLFFFISGWFTFKLSEKNTIVAPAVDKRAVRLLLPMIAVSSLWIFYFPHSGLQSPLDSTFEGLWSNTWKNGYWFTLVLFEIFLVYAATCNLLTKCRNLASCVFLCLGIWAVLIGLFFLVPRNITSWVSLELVAAFYPAFMFGVLAKRHKDAFEQATHNNLYQTIAIIILAGLLYVCSWPWEVNLTPLWTIVAQALLHISAAFIAYAVFERWSDIAHSPDASRITRRIADSWGYIGEKSLGIYLLHYFFLFPMGDLFRPMLTSVNLSLVPMIVFSAFWASCIIGVALIIIKLLAPSKTLSLLLTGNK